MSNNAILNSVVKLRYGEIALQPTKELVEFVPVPVIGHGIVGKDIPIKDASS